MNFKEDIVISHAISLFSYYFFNISFPSFPIFSYFYTTKLQHHKEKQ